METIGGQHRRMDGFDIFHFDLEKAFAIVPHEQPVAKLKTACSDCKIINWIIDYLSG